MTDEESDQEYAAEIKVKAEALLFKSDLSIDGVLRTLDLIYNCVDLGGSEGEEDIEHIIDYLNKKKEES